MAAGQLGGLSRRRAPGPKDAAAGGRSARSFGRSSSGFATRLKERKLITHAELVHAAGGGDRGDQEGRFDFAVVDEAQDIGIAQLRFFAALGGGRPNALFFAGDLGQRIFQQPFSWKAWAWTFAGVRARCGSTTARRTKSARRRTGCSAPSVTDVDGNTEDRERHGFGLQRPAADGSSRSRARARRARPSATGWRSARKAGVLPHEFGVFVRSAAQLDRARAAVERAGLAFRVLDEHVETTSGHVSICTMHLAKGLEFRAVAVMACDDEIIPCKSASKTSATMPTSRRSTTPSVTCSTSPAPVPGIICS